jgi:hypothetical protein
MVLSAASRLILFLAAATAGAKINRSLAEIKMISPAVEVFEGEGIHVQCVVAYHDINDIDDFTVEWVRTVDKAPSVIELLSQNGRVIADQPLGKKYHAFITSVDPDRGLHLREHNFRIQNIDVPNDEGMYACVIKHGDQVISRRDTVIDVLPKESSDYSEDYYYAEAEGPTRIYQDLDSETVPKSTPRRMPPTVQREEIPVSSSGNNGGLLGPVKARFVVAKRGVDVVLECHDATAAPGEKVYWRKDGGK